MFENLKIPLVERIKRLISVGRLDEIKPKPSAEDRQPLPTPGPESELQNPENK